MSRVEIKAPRHVAPLIAMLRHAKLEAILASVVVVALATWALSNPPIPLPIPPPGGVWAITFATIATAVLSHQFRARAGVSSEMRLPRPRYAMFIACVVIAGTPAAVLAAAITPVVVYALDLAHSRVRLGAVMHEAAEDASIVLAAGLIYITITGPEYPDDALLLSTDMWRHVIAALVATIVVFLGLVAVRMLAPSARGGGLLKRARHELGDPVVRFQLLFQLLLLSVGPLVPFAEFMDDRVSLFAWTVFLAPLTAYYYLALLSVRLQQSMDEVRATSAKLGASRRREAELSGYAALVTQVQEDERRRLSRELHDDTAQSLIALSRGLESLGARSEGQPITSQDRHFIGDLVDLSKRTLDGVRRACQDLRPSVLDDLGLSAALESLAHLVTRRGLPCEFRQTGEYEPYAPEIEVTLYRMAQEALSNVQRHAQATHARLEIAYAPVSVEVLIADNGAGFDYDIVAHGARLREDEPAGRSGLGLMGMRERASQIGAALDVHSTPGVGTTIRILVPLVVPGAVTVQAR